MLIPVGQLKVIAVYSKVTVAREVKLFPRVDLPMLEQTGIMIGDRSNYSHQSFWLEIAFELRHKAVTYGK